MSERRLGRRDADLPIRAGLRQADRARSRDRDRAYGPRGLSTEQHVGTTVRCGHRANVEGLGRAG